MPGKISRFVYWTPRILSIAFILFLAIFSLDVFDLDLDFWGTLGGLFMHNIPVLILTAVLVIAWKHEIVGGITFILAGISYIVMMISSSWGEPSGWYVVSYSLIIAVPAIFIGIMFIINWLKKKDSR
jgi:hypothetical protein